MSNTETHEGSDEYQEREAVAVFDDESSLQNAVDSLMQLGLRQADMGVLGDANKLSLSVPTSELEDADDAPRTNYTSSDSRAEGLAAVTGGPALLAGLFAALVVGTGGTALIPAIAVTFGSTAVAGGLGFMLSRIFGRKHADYIEQQIRNGGILLWVRASDKFNDVDIAKILKKCGGRDVHFHVAKRSWGVADVPLHDFEPDPLVRG